MLATESVDDQPEPDSDEDLTEEAKGDISWHILTYPSIIVCVCRAQEKV